MSCDCIKIVNEQLAKQNTKLDVSFGITDDDLDVSCCACVAVAKINPKSRTKPLRLKANFCPFCGVKA